MVEWFTSLGIIEQISLILAIIDVVAGALPNSWLPYKGVMLGVAGVLKDFDVKRKPPAGTTVGIVFLCLAMVNCAGFATFPSVCDDLEGSVLCDIAAKNNVRLEDIGNGLIVVNAVSIGQGLYTKKQAAVVLKEIRDILNNPVSWAAFKIEVYARVDDYPGLLQVADMYFKELENNTRTIYNTDRQILTDWLAEQIEILS